MTYNSTNWQNGDIVTETRLDNIENAIEDILGSSTFTTYLDNWTFSATNAVGNSYSTNEIEWAIEPEADDDNPTLLTAIFDGIKYYCWQISDEIYGPIEGLFWFELDDTWSLYVSDNQEHTISIYKENIIKEGVSSFYFIDSSWEEFEGETLDIRYRSLVTEINNISYNDIETAIYENKIPLIIWSDSEFGISFFTVNRLEYSDNNFLIGFELNSKVNTRYSFFLALQSENRFSPLSGSLNINRKVN